MTVLVGVSIFVSVLVLAWLLYQLGAIRGRLQALDANRTAVDSARAKYAEDARARIAISDVSIGFLNEIGKHIR